MRIRIRDKEYETVADAARDLKVKRNTIYQALHRGNPDVVGLPLSHRRKGKLSFNRSPVTIGNRQWPSISHAAKDLGINRKTLSILIRSGETYRILMAVMKLDANEANQRMIKDVTHKRKTEG